MNSVPKTVTQNSVLSQNWVECTVHPPLAQPARTMCVGPVVSCLMAGYVAGLARPYHRPGPAVSQAWPDLIVGIARPYRGPVSPPARALLRTILQAPRPRRAHRWPYRGHPASYRSPDFTVSGHNGRPLQPRYNNCIVTRPLARP